LFLLVTSAALAVTPPSSTVRREGSVQSSSGDPSGEAVEHGENNADGADPSPVTPDLVNLDDATGLPRTELDRSGAIELAQTVFEPSLMSASFPYGELEVEKFLSNRVARIAPGDQPVLPGTTDPSDTEALVPAAERTMLLDSALPLRTKDSSGEESPVDLTLERSDGSLVASNPLVEVAIPDELGEGVELPESGISLEFPDAPEGLAPSTLNEAAAFYPNVAEDTDLVVVPVPAGVETYSQVRSQGAPRSETFHLSLPDGVNLRSDDAGGIEGVSESGERFLEIPAPMSIDASGAEVPTTAEFSGDSVTVSITPDASTAWPVLVDPSFLVESYGGGIPFIPQEVGQSRCIGGCSTPEGWEEEIFSQSAQLGNTAYNAEFGAGLWISPGGADPRAGDHTNWRWTIPRYWETPKPTTYISRAVLTNLSWSPLWGARESPFLYAGIRSPVGWMSFLSQRGGAGYGLPAYTYEFRNPAPGDGLTESDIGVKELTVGLYAHENLNDSENVGTVHVEGALVEIGEPPGVSPAFGSLTAPEVWMDQSALPIEIVVSDSGLGIYQIHVNDKTGPSLPSWTTGNSCTGLVYSACPRTWDSRFH
jgi:hypothetical protein